MQDLLLPLKIRWMIDLSQPIELRWSPSVLHKLKRGGYGEEIAWEILPCESIASVFVPIYQTHVMSKLNYHLDPQVVFTTIEAMSHDPTYALIWFRSKTDRAIYGGTIIHTLPNMVKVAYRAFDHDLARTRSLRALDYYADYVLQEYVQSRGTLQLSRGLMAHPCDNLGLSIYKLGVGAKPLIAQNVEDQSFQQEELDAMYKKFGVCMYYGDPDLNGYYQKAVVKTESSNDDILLNFQKLAERNGIKVESM